MVSVSTTGGNGTTRPSRRSYWVDRPGHTPKVYITTTRSHSIGSENETRIQRFRASAVDLWFSDMEQDATPTKGLDHHVEYAVSLLLIEEALLCPRGR